MSLRDWRSLTHAEVDPWYRAEEAWWRRSLGWDTADNWAHVERARASGTLPGFVVVDPDVDAPAGERTAGTVASGWTFYVVHRGIVQIGALTANHPQATDRLLEALESVGQTERTKGVLVFVPAADAWLESRLTSRGFAVRPFLYLMRRLDGQAVDAAEIPNGQAYQPERINDLARLLRAAYPGEDPARPFAPAGTDEEWLEYTSQLIMQTGCGLFLPGCSVLVGRPGRLTAPAVAPLDGTVLATRLAPDTGHLAQVAVHPEARGRGLGAAMVQAAIARLAGHGCTRVSLLVAADNPTAVGMYRRLGFEESGRFLSAWRAQPTRSTMAACATAGVSTLR
jgi:ribosomal protein S18 acetylase RimI-like enzyme